MGDVVGLYDPAKVRAKIVECEREAAYHQFVSDELQRHADDHERSARDNACRAANYRARLVLDGHAPPPPPDQMAVG